MASIPSCCSGVTSGAASGAAASSFNTVSASVGSTLSLTVASAVARCGFAKLIPSIVFAASLDSINDWTCLKISKFLARDLLSGWTPLSKSSICVPTPPSPSASSMRVAISSKVRFAFAARSART